MTVAFLHLSASPVSIITSHISVLDQLLLATFTIGRLLTWRNLSSGITSQVLIRYHSISPTQMLLSQAHTGEVTCPVA